MDVRCERCSTEYEFDDALVSGRGTTVKCTNCGHKFKIRRSDGDFSEDFWNVQTRDGRTLVFTSLRELQRAIQTNLVDRNDLLSRGGLKQKAIGQIPELAPFFDQRDQRKSLPPPAAAGETQALRRVRVDEPAQPASPAQAAPPPPPVPAPRVRSAPQPAAPAVSQTRSSRPPPPPVPPAPPLAAPRQRMSTRMDFPPAPGSLAEADAVASMKKTLMGTGEEGPPLPATDPISVPPVPAAPAMRERLASLRTSEPPPKTEREIEPDTERFQQSESAKIRSTPPPLPARALSRSSPPAPPVQIEKPVSAPVEVAQPAAAITAKIPTPARPFRPATPARPFEASSPLPPPTEPVRRSMNFDDEPSSDDIRARAPSYADDLERPASASLGRRRSVGGFIVAAVVAGGVALLGAVWAKDHLGGVLGGSRPPPAATADPRVTSFLTTGEKALADGNLDLAKESFDKASALAERNPHVLLDVARLAAVRADTAWLKSRLLAADAMDEHRHTKESLAELSAAARKAADDALYVAPDDASALRAKIDALRIAGDRDGARALVSRVAPQASQPETAYVLAALDLAETEPLWSTVIERLRVAASAESGPGRARAALAYALARSGDVAGAKAEVERLAGMSRQHALTPLLRAFADRAKAVAKVEPAIDAGPVASAVVDAGRPLRPGEKFDPGDGNRGLPGDPRQLVAQAEKARAKGELDKAHSLYSAALDKNPNDTEALNGLATIAHSRRDLNGARASYKRVLSINPSYVPALVGVADVDWESGDRGSAMKTYKEIVDRFPEGTYPARVKQRVDSGSAPAPAPAPAPTTPPTPPGEPGSAG